MKVNLLSCVTLIMILGIFGNEACSKPAQISKKWYVDADKVGKVPSFHHQKIADILHHLGKPVSKQEFSMAECCSEFQIELMNTYNPHDATSKNIRIRQWQWNHLDKHLVLWFHKVGDEWIVLDTVKWPDGVDF